MRRPISRVRSVTETIMMFMMPTPPTTREIIATHEEQLRHHPAGGGEGVGHFGHVADGEVVHLVRLDVMAVVQHGGDLLNGQGNVLR